MYEDLTQAFFGCATVFHNEMMYFGGVGADAKQVRSTFIFFNVIIEPDVTFFIKMAKVDKKGCALKRMSDLEFTFEGGACNTFNQTTASGTQEVVYLCFGDTENTKCRT